ncbi:hypothetical protein [Dechloromonas sp. CZR5]|uniref:hypothetical protein n=1 Tax=Dechloromonas sp. CZR5 TaxID=2608630 RepID=UPI00168C0B49|nr:hypothetical protein [Dechloromonas sp. CZR5]
MSEILKKLRADFEMVAEHALDRKEWSQDDFKEFGAAIKAAADSNDLAVLILWARDMAIRANHILYSEMVIRSVEAGMRARIEADKAAKAGAK